MHVYEKTETGIEPRHYVEMTTKNGTRPTTLRDYKKWREKGLEVYPSVTTILDVLNKPALITWKVNQHLNAVLNHPEVIKSDNFLKDVAYLAKMEMDKAPTAGTNVHEVLEDFFNNKVPAMDTPEFEIVTNVWNAISHATDYVIPEGEAEVMVASDLGYAGCVDLVLDGWIIDYKTKLEASKFKPGNMAYDDHAIQLAAYRQVINPSARCANIFICIETGEVDFHEHSEADLTKGWDIFSHALEIWKLKNQ